MANNDGQISSDRKSETTGICGSTPETCIHTEVCYGEATLRYTHHERSGDASFVSDGRRTCCRNNRRSTLLRIQACAGINWRVSWRMKFPLSEGKATHTGLESCTGVRKGVCEALTKACIGWVLSPVKVVEVPTFCLNTEGNIHADDKASLHGTSRGRRPQACALTTRARTGRSPGLPG